LKEYDVMLNTLGYDADLFDAVEYGELEWIEALLASSPTWVINIDAQDTSGKTALIVATLWGRDDVVELLLRYGADPDVKDISGATALAYAAAQDDESICTILRTPSPGVFDRGDQKNDGRQNRTRTHSE
jgi:ankyrin repeat protein